MTNGDPDDVGPGGEEAEAEREATVMPWIWGAIGMVAIAVFIACLIFIKPQAPPPAVPQKSAPAGQAR
ncbi:MAG: hypothetical protein JO127_08485 [Caulobacteraceae bacterium]|nr:hypothetical protein [Caulobacteraceae bacterium]